MSFFAEFKRRNVLRVVAGYAAISWLLIQVVGTVFPFFGFSDTAIRGVMIVLIIGFVPAVAVSWVFEWTPEGLRRDSDVDSAAPSAIAMGKRLDRIVIVALVLAVGYFAVDKFVFDPAEDAAIRQEAKEEGRTEALVGSYGDKSIAVLPFTDMSPDGNQAHFSEGIAEELLNLLARIPELRVISRSSAFAIVKEDLQIPAIAERLRVAHILEGSVRRTATRIRITAQLIDARSDTHLWSKTYDREFGDVFEIQEDIAIDVVNNLKVQLMADIPRLRRTSPEVYGLTLQARYLRNSGRGSDIAIQARELLERAVELDPGYQPAVLGLALALYSDLQRGGYDPALGSKRIPELLQRAQEIDPDDPVLASYLAWGLFERDRNYEQAASAFEAAVTAAPGNAEILRIAGLFATNIGSHEVATTLHLRAVERDPLCFTCIYDLARSYENVGDYDEALAAQRRYMTLGEGGGGSLGILQLYRREPELALAAFEGERTNDFQVNSGRAMALHDLGRIRESEEALQRQIKIYGESRPLEVAKACAWLGRNDCAFDWLEKEIGNKPLEFVYELHDPIWNKLHDDPRWLDWRNRIDMSEDRLSAIEFNPVLPD